MGACERSAIRLVHATVGVLSDQTPARTNHRSTFLLEDHIVEEDCRHFQVQVGEGAAWVCVRDYLLGDGGQERDSPHQRA